LCTAALFVALPPGCAASAFGDQDEHSASLPLGAFVTVTLSETTEAFRNPMKGFRPSRYIQDGSFKDYEYASTYKHYIPYSDLESTAGDSVQKIKDYGDAHWAGLADKNLKVIPRVVILYPGTGEYWGDIPHDGSPNQWASDALKNRLAAFAAKLGQAWDDDPRVAAVEMGLWGKWGEHNIYPDTVNGSDRIPLSFQDALGSAFAAAFKKKKVMVRYPETFKNFADFGFIWDSFALPDDDNAAGGAGIVARDVWRTQMESGEVAYDWGNQSNLGGSPNGTLSSNANTDYVIGYIQKVHTSSLGWIAEYTPDDGTISANAARMQKSLGYRFVITAATFNSSLGAGETLSVSLDVRNDGVAPFYYNWPVEVSLLSADRQVSWTGVFSGVDITRWLPGGPYTITGSFSPAVANGTYTLAVAVLDPSGNKPSLRFANANYYRGGRTALGKIGIGAAAADQNVAPFDGLRSDASLSYGPHPTCSGDCTHPDGGSGGASSSRDGGGDATAERSVGGGSGGNSGSQNEGGGSPAGGGAGTAGSSGQPGSGGGASGYGGQAGVGGTGGVDRAGVGGAAGGAGAAGNAGGGGSAGAGRSAATGGRAGASSGASDASTTNSSYAGSATPSTPETGCSCRLVAPSQSSLGSSRNGAYLGLGVVVWFGRARRRRVGRRRFTDDQT
jgi:hypothetical protein